ncbi:zinc ribbon domain-containing protein [Chloroflexota bacterium]
MPIYEYECLECDEHFELRRSMSDNDLKIKCPKCGAENSRRIYSAFATPSGGSCAPSSPT